MGESCQNHAAHRSDFLAGLGLADRPVSRGLAFGEILRWISLEIDNLSWLFQ
jgi:hypothetical protein